MATLRIGYDLFAGSSQAGTDGGVGGNVQIETAKALAYRLTIQRLSDNHFWDDTAQAFGAGDPAEADEYLVPGSAAPNPSAIRRLLCKIPEAACLGITSAGFKIIAYAAGDTPSSAGVDMTLEFAP
jgi:hypothetical protein